MRDVTFFCLSEEIKTQKMKTQESQKKKKKIGRKSKRGKGWFLVLI